MRTKRRRQMANASRAIAFSLLNGPNDEVVEVIKHRLRETEKKAEVMFSYLDGTIYAEPFTTIRSQQRAQGILRGFVQVDRSSIAVLTIDEVNRIFSDHRRALEKLSIPLPI